DDGSFMDMLRGAGRGALTGAVVGSVTGGAVHGVARAVGFGWSRLRSATMRPRAGGVASANPTARFLEYKALRAQGLNASEAYGLMKQFDAGVVSPDQFLFRFTTVRGGQGIVTEGALHASRRAF